MSVTEAQRHHLYESLKTHLGSAEADTLMNLIPPTDWPDIATKADVAQLEGRMEQTATTSDLAEVRTELAELRADVRTEIADVRTEIADVRTEVAELRSEVRTEFAGVRLELGELRSELRTDIAEVKPDLLRTLGTWLFASQAAVITAVAALVTFTG